MVFLSVQCSILISERTTQNKYYYFYDLLLGAYVLIGKKLFWPNTINFVSLLDIHVSQRCSTQFSVQRLAFSVGEYASKQESIDHPSIPAACGLREQNEAPSHQMQLSMLLLGFFDFSLRGVSTTHLFLFFSVCRVLSHSRFYKSITQILSYDQCVRGRHTKTAYIAIIYYILFSEPQNRLVLEISAGAQLVFWTWMRLFPTYSIIDRIVSRSIRGRNEITFVITNHE